MVKIILHKKCGNAQDVQLGNIGVSIDNEYLLHFDLIPFQILCEKKLNKLVSGVFRKWITTTETKIYKKHK